MPKRHDAKRDRVSEPVQVYLAHDEKRVLERLADQLSLSMSDVVRRAIAALERQVLHPDHHPALRLIGLAGEEPARPLGYDVAMEHDRFLADVGDPANAKPSRPRKRRAR